MTRHEDRNGGSSRPPTGGPAGNPSVNFELASQLLSALSTGLSAGQPAGGNNYASRPTGNFFPQQTHQSANAQAQASGQLLLQQLGLQQEGMPPRSADLGHHHHHQHHHHHHDAGVSSSRKESGNPREEAKTHRKKGSRSDMDKARSSIVPCRARAMPPDHNGTTAYFVIPADVKHGENLVCSFPRCRDEGIKFCYCKHCGVPVAKRNFRQRHEHEDKMTSKKSGDGHQSSGKKHSSAADSPRLPKRRRTNGQQPQHQQQESETTPDGFAQQGENNTGGTRRNDEAPMKNLVFQRKMGQAAQNGADPSQAEIARQNRWATLLRSRPSDAAGDEMSKWLLAVLKVSNPGGESDAGNSVDSNDAREESNPQDSSVSNENTESSSSERSAGSGASGGAGWNSSSEAFESGDSSEPSESPSGGNNGAGDEHDRHFAMRPPHQRVPVVSDFRNSTESPSGSTDAGGVDTTTSGTNCDPTSGSGSNDSNVTERRDASSSLSGSAQSSESSNARGKQDFQQDSEPKKRQAQAVELGQKKARN